MEELERDEPRCPECAFTMHIATAHSHRHRTPQAKSRRKVFATLTGDLPGQCNLPEEFPPCPHTARRPGGVFHCVCCFERFYGLPPFAAHLFACDGTQL